MEIDGCLMMEFLSVVPAMICGFLLGLTVHRAYVHSERRGSIRPMLWDYEEGEKRTSRKVSRLIEKVDAGDLVRVEWFDASIGRSLASGTAVDIPVKSWGIYIALLGEKSKHIVLAQNSFRYTEDIYDVDYASIPLSWAADIAVINRAEVSPEVADRLLKSFLSGRCRTIKKRTQNHAKIDQASVKENANR